MANMKNTDWVDYAKAIGIILVVYGHVARGLYNAGIESSVTLYKLVDSIIYSFHMPLFFFLSGLFFYSSFSKRGGKQLVFSKVDTIFYPYLVWSIFQGSIEVFLSGYTNTGNISFSDVLALLWAPRAQFWFLYALFVIFVVSSAIYSVVPKRLSILVFLLAILLYLFPSVLPDLNFYHFLSRYFVFFSFGIIFMMYVKIEYISTTFTFFVSLVAFVVCQWLFHDYLSLNYKDKGIESLLLAFISIIFMISSAIYLSNKSYGYLVFIGKSSMAIYLMHILAGSGIRIILHNFFVVDSYFVHLVLGFLVGVLAPLAILKIINSLKIPYVFSAPVSACLKFSIKK